MSGRRHAAYRARRKTAGLPCRPPKKLEGPTEVGQVGHHAESGNWYVVHKVGKHGGTSGPCVYGPSASPLTCEQLRSKTKYVPPEQVPEAVVVAIGRFALTGKATRLAS